MRRMYCNGKFIGKKEKPLGFYFFLFCVGVILCGTILFSPGAIGIAGITNILSNIRP